MLCMYPREQRFAAIEWNSVWSWRLNNAGKYCDRSTYRRCRFWQKKVIFSYEAHFDLGGYENKQNCRIWGTENAYAYISKPMHLKRVTVWFEFWSRGIIEPFFFENEQEKAVTVNVDRYRAMLDKFLFTNIKEEDICNIWFQQPKLHLLFCALFLKIALSAAIVALSFGHLGAAIWHRWTIICGVPSKIKVRSTSQRQVMF